MIMAYIVMEYIVKAYIAMAHVVMAYGGRVPWRRGVRAGGLQADTDRWELCDAAGTTYYIGHNLIGHNLIGHNCIGHAIYLRPQR